MTESIRTYLTDRVFFMEILDRAFRDIAAADDGYVREQLIKKDSPFII